MYSEFAKYIRQQHKAIHQPINRPYPRTPLGHAGRYEGHGLFLSSHASDYLNGAVIPVDGGYLVK